MVLFRFSLWHLCLAVFKDSSSDVCFSFSLLRLTLCTTLSYISESPLHFALEVLRANAGNVELFDLSWKFSS